MEFQLEPISLYCNLFLSNKNIFVSNLFNFQILQIFQRQMGIFLKNETRYLPKDERIHKRIKRTKKYMK